MIRKTIISIISLIIISINIKFLIGILLDKKYIVDELSSVKNLDSLNSVQNIIESDYLFFMCLVSVNSIWIVVLVLIFLLHKQRPIGQ